MLATKDNPSKNDFVLTCNKYLKELNIQLSFEELAKMSKRSVKKLVKLKQRRLHLNTIKTIKNNATEV